MAGDRACAVAVGTYVRARPVIVGVGVERVVNPQSGDAS